MTGDDDGDEDEAPEELAQAAFTRATERSPRKVDWGLYAYGDGPPAAGGGVGGFAWFAERREMIASVAKHLVYFYGAPATKDPAIVAKKVAAAIKGMGTSASGREAGRKRVNAELEGIAQIQWWGTFASLLEGDGAFERKVRAAFRGHDGGEEDGEERSEADDDDDDDDHDDDDPGSVRSPARPIAAREVAAFREYLETYGL